MLRTRMSVRSAALALCASAAVVFLSPPPTVACPPSEGDLDLEGYDISGDGVVQLPEAVRWRVTPTVAGERGAVTLRLEDPTKDNNQVLTLKLTATAASEVKQWLGDAVEAQQKFLAEKTYTEQAGMRCSLDARQCRAAVEKGATHIAMPRAYVSLASATGSHGWSMIAAEPRTPQRSCSKPCGGPADTAAKAPADQRITLRAYQMTDLASQPLTVKMDLPTAKRLLADMTTSLEGKTPKAPADEAKPAQPAGEAGKDHKAQPDRAV